MLLEIGKLTGTREANGASDAGRGYQRAGVNFQFFSNSIGHVRVMLSVFHLTCPFDTLCHSIDGTV